MGRAANGDPAEAEYEPAEASEWLEASTSERRHDRDDGEESATAAPVDLHAHLLWQLHLSHLGPRDLAIGQALVEAINDDGYLEEPLQELAVSLAGPDDLEQIDELVHRFTVAQRLLQAQQLLRHSPLPLGEVALACGFASASHFSNRFRQALGATPGQYRQSFAVR